VAGRADYVQPAADAAGPDVPVEQSPEVAALTVLLQAFNAVHLPRRFREHVAGRFYRTGRLAGPTGEPVVVGGWSVPASVGAALYELVADGNLADTLEIGLAYGLSALFVCQAHADRTGGRHVAIDPWQPTTFRNIGLRTLERAALADRLRLIEAPDYQALPQLLAEGKRFDLVFVDGLHIFDHTLLDFFYADRMLRVGGYIAFDDCSFPAVEAVLSYVLANRAYEPIGRHHERLAVLRKLADDDRPERDVCFHQPF
jgi:predicted O-methyltransferase YrrM